MAPQNPFLDAWRSALQQWETEANKVLSQATESEGSAKALNDSLSGAVQLQAVFKDAMEKALTTFNLPSGDDLLRLSEQISQVEHKLDIVLAGTDCDRPAGPSSWAFADQATPTP